MPSYSRNSRKPMQVLRLIIAGAVQGGALLAGSAAQAADQPNKFVMTAFESAAGGDSLVRGQYADALAITKRSPARGDAMVKTNECVAYTMTGQFAAAQAVCDSAVASAKQDLRQAHAPVWQLAQLQDTLAVAYSNRAVLHWLSHNNGAAEHDLSDASTLSPKADFVARNESALHSPTHEHTVAQVVTTPGQ